MIYITEDTFNTAYNEANAQPFIARRNLLAVGTIQSALVPTEGPRANAVNENTADFWAPLGSSNLRADLAAADSADVAFFAAHTMAGLTVNIQRLVGIGTWATIATAVPETNQPFAMIFPTDTSAGWGFSVSGACVVGVAFIGRRAIIPGGVQPGYRPVAWSRQYQRWGGGSRRGHWMGQRVDSVSARINPVFAPVPRTLVEVNLAGFGTHYNEGRPFIFASAPSIFTRDVAYCWAPDGATFSPVPLAGGDLCEFQLAMDAYCEV